MEKLSNNHLIQSLATNFLNPIFPVWLLFVFGSRNKQISKHKRILFFFNISSWYFSTYICFGWCVWMCVPICHPTTKCVFVFVSLYVCVAEYVTKMVFGLKISKLTWAKLLCAWICVWYISEWGKETTVAHNCYLYHAYASNGMYMYSLMVIFMIIGIHRKNQIEQTFQFRREWAHNSANWMDDGGGWGKRTAKNSRQMLTSIHNIGIETEIPSQTKCTYTISTHTHTHSHCSHQGHSFIAHRYTYVNVLFKANCPKLPKMAINNNL